MPTEATTYVLALADPAVTLEKVGGKGASLARLARADLPVPRGFHITTAAYNAFVAAGVQTSILDALESLDPSQTSSLEATSQRIAHSFTLAVIPRKISQVIADAYADLGGDDVPVAVRSSATAEDLPGMSFAGQQETFLNVCGAEEVLERVRRCWASLWTARAIGYRLKMGVDQRSLSTGVVVQIMVPSEVSGVLFTANPLTGDRKEIVVNAGYGVGEVVVSGQVTPDSLVLDKGTLSLKESKLGTKGLAVLPSAGTGTRVEAVAEHRRGEWALSGQQLRELGDLAARVETEFGGVPQDIEWAVAEGHCWLPQARPMTGLPLGPAEYVRAQQPSVGDGSEKDLLTKAPVPDNLATYEINDSLVEDALWINANVGEAIPDVFTPLTWSLVRALDDEAAIIPGYYTWSGNICGRVYTNISYRLSAIATLRGWDAKRSLSVLGDVFGRIPKEADVPLHPFSRWSLTWAMLSSGLRFLARYLRASRNMPGFLLDNPEWCTRMTKQIGRVKTRDGLLSTWKVEIGSYTSKAWWSMLAGTGNVFISTLGLSAKLSELVGTEDANALLASFRGDSELASLGPLSGISQVSRGEMSREDYLSRYGHRGPHEFELSIPHPTEDSSWLERRVEEFKRSESDVDELLHEQRSRHEKARAKIEARFPQEAKRFERQLGRIARQSRLREASRSEFTRVFRLIRAFAIRAGDLAGVGDHIFFLYLEEVVKLLSGDDTAVRHIPARIETYNKYCALPAYPSVIRGRFDPFQWAQDPNRRSDYYDATVTSTSVSLTGPCHLASPDSLPPRSRLRPEPLTVAECRVPIRR